MKNNNGFTLVELLVVIAVSGILLTAVYFLLISGFNNFYLGTDRAKIQSDIRLVENILNNELRNVECIEIASLGECTDFDSSFILESEDGLLYFLNQNGRRITEDIFTNIYFEVKSNNIFELVLAFDKRELYKINMFLNNYSFSDEDIGLQISLIDYQLNYKK